jgi:putative transposase
MIDYELNAKELKEIQEGMHYSPKAEVRQRATAIHLLHLGQSPEEVSAMMAVSIGSIYNWHKRWRREGLAGLANKAKSGRPKNANQAYCDLLEQTLAHEPSEYGYGFGIWTVDRLREHLYRETGIVLSNRRFRALLKDLGYVYRRPKHDLTRLQDVEEKERSRALLDWLKKDLSQEDIPLSLWTKQL